MKTPPDDASERILAAAQELFGERGYRGTTTRAIAERAEVNEVTVFRVFGTKQGLLRSLGESWARETAGFAIRDTPDPRNTRARLQTMANLEVEQAEALGPLALRLAIEASAEPELSEVLPATSDANLDGLADYLAERQTAGDLRRDVDPLVMAEAFFALTSSMVMSRQLVGRSEPPLGPGGRRWADQIFDLFWAGVREPGERPGSEV